MKLFRSKLGNRLLIKAKLVGIESKIATLDDEFLAYNVLPTGQTIGEIMSPQIDKIVKGGNVPLLLKSE